MTPTVPPATAAAISFTVGPMTTPLSMSKTCTAATSSTTMRVFAARGRRFHECARVSIRGHGDGVVNSPLARSGVDDTNENIAAPLGQQPRWSTLSLCGTATCLASEYSAPQQQRRPFVSGKRKCLSPRTKTCTRPGPARRLVCRSGEIFCADWQLCVGRRSVVCGGAALPDARMYVLPSHTEG